MKNYILPRIYLAVAAIAVLIVTIFFMLHIGSWDCGRDISPEAIRMRNLDNPWRRGNCGDVDFWEALVTTVIFFLVVAVLVKVVQVAVETAVRVLRQWRNGRLSKNP